ncbi:Predicted dienelactone hydrolase [Legionella steigerwaltii]|uniref:Isoform II n=1 Tax=Legionella steigerwaltii TaxID=460 RepID=A0A378LDX5_9GAMM|nr:isoform II [Legionella steigerwaltii]STY24078.1 Predicted dienelactone hydrolase [Legionella steigerwaltii]
MELSGQGPTYSIMIALFKKYFLYSILLSHLAMAGHPLTDYLLKPTGKYGVSFKDLHWVNDAVCPDPNFSEKREKDFTLDNKKHCHELMVRIYYPVRLKDYGGVPYYPPIIYAEQNILKTKPGVKPEDIEKLSLLKSHTTENAPIVKKAQFPVVLFISGLGGVVQLYENLITELVSQGYIVVGINSVFVNGDILLPNNRIVSMVDPQSWDVVTQKTIPILERDIAFVYKRIHDTAQDDVFKSMDLHHIGALGHSFGGRAIANAANHHEKWFQALVTFDMEVHMGSFESKNAIPAMHFISAYWRSMFPWFNLHYRLNKNGFLVTLSPNKNEKHYSYHMNFTDFSTLQYMPAYQASMKSDQAKRVHQNFGNYLGKGNGVQITKAINRYLIDFFNVFLKDKKNSFSDCSSLTNNTYIKCGPGIF